jgi:hypothetical protein
VVNTGKAVATSGQTKWSSERFSDGPHRLYTDQLDECNAPHRPPQHQDFACTMDTEPNVCDPIHVLLTDRPRDERSTVRRQFPQFTSRSTSV